jgi:YbgC/YbaW family acyl-CoA thioester hydrolase
MTKRVASRIRHRTVSSIPRVYLAGLRSPRFRVRLNFRIVRATICSVATFHRIDVRVMWPDADPAGIVWFGVFFRYCDNAEEELFRALGSDRTVLLRELKIFMPRTSLECGFLSPARLGDELSVGVGIGELGDRRITYTFDIRERVANRLICEASYRVACVDAGSFAPRAFPSEVVALLAPALSLP